MVSRCYKNGVRIWCSSAGPEEQPRGVGDCLNVELKIMRRDGEVSLPYTAVWCDLAEIKMIPFLTGGKRTELDDWGLAARSL